ncbi:MAG: DUF2130 domain-containing protein [Proteobacteria bacterium]|nr:DUF2130 domain-containing protein [Pseudomonadota bacterium]
MATKNQEAHSLLLPAQTRVTCPSCSAKFSLQEGFARQALEKFEQSTEGALEAVREAERHEAEKAAARLHQQLKDREARHAEALKEARALGEQAVAPQLAVLRQELAERQTTIQKFAQREAALHAREQGLETRIKEEARVQAATLFATDRSDFEQRLALKDQQVAELRAAELTLRQEKAALQDRAAGLDNEVARKIDAGRSEIEARARAQEREKAEFEKADLKKRLDDVNAQLEEAQRKGVQGSQQLQGEVLELTLQDDLEAAFPLDAIEEVRKGARGGDVIQRVMTRGGQVAGVLLWEAKRARDWSVQWPQKLKEDLRGCGGDVAVLVTMGTAFPRDWEPGQQFGLHEDCWVTSWATALQLATVLRTGILDVHKQRAVSAGKGEKMEAVYDYLTSSQFAQKLKAIYGAFYRMRQELESEKSQTQQRWARREKQLQLGIAELVGVAGDIQGLAQQDLPLLEIEGAPDSLTVPESEAPQLGLRMDPRDKDT